MGRKTWVSMVLKYRIACISGASLRRRQLNGTTTSLMKPLSCVGDGEGVVDGERPTDAPQCGTNLQQDARNAGYQWMLDCHYDIIEAPAYGLRVDC